MTFCRTSSSVQIQQGNLHQLLNVTGRRTDNNKNAIEPHAFYYTGDIWISGNDGWNNPLRCFAATAILARRPRVVLSMISVSLRSITTDLYLGLVSMFSITCSRVIHKIKAYFPYKLQYVDSVNFRLKNFKPRHHLFLVPLLSK